MTYLKRRAKARRFLCTRDINYMGLFDICRIFLSLGIHQDQLSLNMYGRLASRPQGIKGQFSNHPYKAER